MNTRWFRSGGAMFLAGVLTLAGCGSKGEDGATGSPGAAGQNGQDGQDGTNGQNGQNGAPGQNGTPGSNGQDLTAVAKPESCVVCHPTAGADHQTVYNSAFTGSKTHTDALVATIGAGDVTAVPAVSGAAGKFDVTLTVTLKKNGVAITDVPSTSPVTTPATPSNGTGVFGKGGQVTAYVQEYNTVTGGFDKAKNFSFPKNEAGNWVSLGGGKYSVTKLDAAFNPTASASALVYAYFADENDKLAQTPKTGHYALYSSVASVSKVFGAVGYTSTASVAGCQKCHGAPYRKHGYREAVVAGLNDFVACKACHYDDRAGTDFDWQVLADDIAAYVATPMKPDNSGKAWTAGQTTKYAYKAKLMNDTHMSHAMEFAYPQSMANCVTCHGGPGQLAAILADSKFTVETCKSCHPVTGTGSDPKRAPALLAIFAAKNVTSMHSIIDMYAVPAAGEDCNKCHKAGGQGKTFLQLHAGRDAAVYKADGTKYSDSIAAQIDQTGTSYDATSKKLTVKFTVAGTDAGALVKPTVVISLYGYDSKDFVVAGHGSQPAPDSKRNLEWAEAASGNSPRLTVSPAVATAGNTTWTAVADLGLWASKITDGSVKRAQINVLPVLGLDQTKAVQTDPTKAAYNPAIAIAGDTQTITLSTSALSVAPAIVDPAKCNKCHEALGTTFHSPSYGSAGVVGCRVCHTVRDGGAHLEMQSRSIDSYVHAIHSFQYMDAKTLDFADPVAAFEYGEHTEATYPNFLIQNCESCHVSGSYEVPDQAKSMPGMLSAAGVNASWDRAIGAVPAMVTGPASRACGSCHRAQAINEDDAAKLTSLNAHIAAAGTQLDATTSGSTVLDNAIVKIMSLFK